MKSTNWTRRITTALVILGALTAAPMAYADDGNYGPADGWMPRALEGSGYGAPDGWMARALDSSAAAVYRAPDENASRLALADTKPAFGPPDGWMPRALEGSGYGEPDGWTTRALEGATADTYRGPREDAARVALVHTYGAPDGWMPRALERAEYGAPDGWMTRALEGANSGGGVVSTRLAAVSAQPTTGSSGFDYGDAAIGSAATLSLLLLIGIPLTVVRRHGASHVAG